MNIFEAPKPSWLKGVRSYSLSLCVEDTGQPVTNGGWVDGAKGRKDLTIKGHPVRVDIYQHKKGTIGIVKGAITYDGQTIYFGFEGDHNWIRGPLGCPAFLKHGHKQHSDGYNIESMEGLLQSEKDQHKSASSKQLAFF